MSASFGFTFARPYLERYLIGGVMVKDKIETGRRFNPERYGMIYCPVCKGIGKLFNKLWEESVCEMCGGFGLIKKEEEIKKQLRCGRFNT